MRNRWYAAVIAIGVALQAALEGFIFRRRSQARADQPTPDRPAIPPLAAAPQLAQPASTLPSVTSSRQMPETNWLARIAVGSALLAVILLAVQAQSIFVAGPWEERDAGIPYALAAMLGFSLVAYLADRWLGRANEAIDCPTAPHKIAAPAHVHPLRELQVIVRDHRLRAIGIIASIIMGLIVLVDLRAVPELPDYTVTLGLWLTSIVVFVAAVAIQKPKWRRDWKSWWQSNWPLVAAISAIGSLALILRVYDLGSIPPTMGGDEGSQGVEALKILRGELRNPFITSWMSVPTMSFFFNALTIGPLGNTVLALRLPWALIGSGTVLIVFALARRLKGLVMGVLVGMLLAAYHFHIHFSRLGSNQVADACFMAAAFFFLYRAYDEGGMLNWVMAGLVAGLAQYFYAGARFTTIMVGVTIIYFVARERLPFVRVHWRGMIALAVMFLIAAGPMLQFAQLHPNEFNGRLNVVGIFQSGWLTREVQLTGRSETDLLLEQFKRAALAYNAYPDRTSWYGSPRPLFDGLWSILFMLGLGYATLRPLDRRLFPMLIWWWGAIILGGMLTESPPSSQRLITSAPPAVFFVALAIWKSGQIVQRLFRRPERISAGVSSFSVISAAPRRYILPALAALVVGILCWLSISWYFKEYTPSRVYGNYTAVTADALVRYAQEKLDSTYRMVFFGAPQMYVGFGSIKYLLPDIPGQDISEPLTAPFDPRTLPDEKRPIFIFMPFRRHELTYVEQTYPNGRVEELSSPMPGAMEPLLTIYRVAN